MRTAYIGKRTEQSKTEQKGKKTSVDETKVNRKNGTGQIHVRNEPKKEQNRTEQIKTDQTEQNTTEQIGTEQNRTEKKKIEQNRT